MKILKIKINYPTIEFLDYSFNVDEFHEYPDETDPNNWKEYYCIPELNLWGFDDLYNLLLEISKHFGYDDYIIED